MKVIEIMVAGSDREPMILELCPGMTTRDILTKADLADFELSRASEPMKFLSPEDALYDLLTDCETLIATFSTKQADAFMEHIAFGEGEI